ncbi:gliding motility-associated C-terminal domain-containing protein [Roseivirga sp. BDSF3-8]|uniref:T9SS type B sorting domain-containing protein n=1 Tax=Roseivirga sp. BDSF3-8 TaxID=3241598 RepID=UPI0035321F63
MRHVTICLFLFLVCTGARATHIVGGEIELEHTGGYYYTLRLIQYFDRVNGSPGAEDQDATLVIFSKARNRRVDAWRLNQVQKTEVEYTQPECAIAELETNKLVYERRIYLDPTIYNDPQGYYVTYERCCRNNIINNIVLPEGTGQTFYLEFPPVQLDQQPFVNSTPQLFPPLSDYGCVFKPYYADFGGTDPDGDSLVYSLVDPLNSSTGEPIPNPRPAPHPSVTWETGYDTDNQIRGIPPLSISTDGLLTVTPTQPGLFVFSVKCEEYRNGRRIGEVRRDFQLLVITDCNAGQPPVITANINGDSRRLANNELITIREQDASCIDFKVTDGDTQLRGEQVSIRARAVNFDPADYGWSWGQQSKFLASIQDTLSTSVCLDKCPVPGVDPLIIDFIAGDNSCPKPLLDTLRVRIHIDRDIGTPAYFSAPVAERVERRLLTGQSFSMEVVARDDDLDSLLVWRQAEGISPESVGVAIDLLEESRGFARYRVSWTPQCEKFVDMPVSFAMLADDIDSCGHLTPPDTVYFDLMHVAPEPSQPVLTTNAPDNLLQVRVRESIRFDLFGNDIDNDSLYLTLDNADELPPDFIYQFAGASGTGSITAPFAYTPGCEALRILDDTLQLRFVLRSVYDCGMEFPDTVIRNLLVQPPVNNAPVISVAGEPGPVDYRLTVGESLTLNIQGNEADNDEMYMAMLPADAERYEGLFTFEPVTGRGQVNSPFIWTPGCEQLSGLPEENRFTVRLVVRDQYCDGSLIDTLTLNLELQDLEVDYNFDIANAFTPNGDSFSEEYFIKELPPDNCASQFESFTVYNRWGKEVFFTRERDFHWDGGGVASGTYYYQIKFTHNEFRGPLHIIF